MGLLTPELRAEVGKAGAPVRVEVTRREIQKYAIATRQRLAAYLEGDRAPPMFHYMLFRELDPLERLRQDGLSPDPLTPKLPLPRVMAGGAETTYARAIRPGDVLVGTPRIVDIHEKSGSQGPLIFVVIETRVETEAGELVLVERSTRIAR